MGMFLFAVSFLVGVAFAIKLILGLIRRKPIKLDIAVIVICFMLFIAGAYSMTEDDTEKKVVADEPIVEDTRTQDEVLKNNMKYGKKEEVEPTEEEKQAEIDSKLEAKENIRKIQEHINNTDRLQQALDQIKANDNKVKGLEVTDSSNVAKSVDVKLTMAPLGEVKVYEIGNLRNRIVDGARETFEGYTVKVSLYTGQDHIDTYTFRKGWDKSVTPE